MVASNRMTIHAQIERVSKLIEDAEWMKQHAATQADQERACKAVKALKAEKRQLEKLEKRFSPNQLRALEALERL
jgi:hypothetical protein